MARPWLKGCAYPVRVGGNHSRSVAALLLCATAVVSWFAAAGGCNAWITANRGVYRLTSARPALRASPKGLESGEFDFGEFDAPVGVSVAEAKEEQEFELAPPESELFMRRETGEYQCASCGWQYSPFFGFRDFSPGTKWVDIPEEFECPECGAAKKTFTPIVEDVAGFAENQEYGLGFNTWTGGQKGILIWGGLGLAFLALLGGYGLD